MLSDNIPAEEQLFPGRPPKAGDGMFIAQVKVFARGQCAGRVVLQLDERNTGLLGGGGREMEGPESKAVVHGIICGEQGTRQRPKRIRRLDRDADGSLRRVDFPCRGIADISAACRLIAISRENAPVPLPERGPIERIMEEHRQT